MKPEKQTDASKAKELKDIIFKVLDELKYEDAFAGGYLARVSNETVLEIEQKLKALGVER